MLLDILLLTGEEVPAHTDAYHAVVILDGMPLLATQYRVVDGFKLVFGIIQEPITRGGDEVLGMTSVLDLLFIEGIDGMITTVGAQVTLHHHSLELVGIGLHPDDAHAPDGDQSADGLIPHVAYLHDGLLLFARYHEVAIGIAHATTEESGRR